MAGIVGVVVITVLAWFVITKLASRVWLLYRLGYLPHADGSHWLWGHALALADSSSLEERWERWLRQNPRLLVIRIFLTEFVSLCHPETAALILRSKEPKSEIAYGIVRSWLGEGLLVSNGRRWVRDRRLLTRGFHFDILRDYVPIYREATAIMLDKWADDSGSGLAVNVSSASTLLTLDIILRCIMSYESNCQNVDGSSDTRDYANAVQELTRLTTARFFNPFHRNDFLYSLTKPGREFHRLRSLARSVSQSIINRRRIQLQASGEDTTSKRPRHLDFLDILLTVRDDQGQGLTDKDIQEQVDTFLFGGHDTTASALQWTIHYLATYPMLQERCRDEVRSIVGHTGDISHEHLSNMVYVTQFIKEAMRISSTVPFISRQLVEDLKVDNYTLPKGTWAHVPIYAIHHNPAVWDKPSVFDPERFSPEENAKRHPFAFVPFSAGPRNCIGQNLAMDELKTIIALILLRFQLRRSSTCNPSVVATMVSQPSENIFVHVDDAHI